MTKQEKSSAFSRRSLLKAGGAFVVSVGAPMSLDALLGIGVGRTTRRDLRRHGCPAREKIKGEIS